MPFNTALVVSTARLSADLWQRLACQPELIPSDQLIDLLIFFPLRQICRCADHLWTYLCVPPPSRQFSRYSHYYSTDDDSDDDSGRDEAICSAGAGDFSSSSSSGSSQIFLTCGYSSAHSD